MFSEKSMPRKKLYVWGRIHWDRVDAFSLLLTLQGRVGSENKRPTPYRDLAAILASDHIGTRILNPVNRSWRSSAVWGRLWALLERSEDEI